MEGEGLHLDDPRNLVGRLAAMVVEMALPHHCARLEHLRHSFPLSFQSTERLDGFFKGVSKQFHFFLCVVKICGCPE